MHGKGTELVCTELKLTQNHRLETLVIYSDTKQVGLFKGAFQSI